MSKVVDWSAEERKLQSVYDDVAAGRYKPAEAAVSRYLKKHPKSQPALIIRFVLLERLGSTEKLCLKALADAQKVGELSARGLWWAGITLRNMQRLDLCVKVYQDAWDARPDSQEIGEQVFLHASAAWETETMVKSSRKMFNLSKTAVWARVAAWAEWVHRAPQPSSSEPYPPPAPEGSLKIACTILSTTPPDAPSSEILWLRSQILISAGQLKAAHELLVREGTGGSLARDWWRMEGIQEIAKRAAAGQGDISNGAGSASDVAWAWENELGEFLNVWTADKEARRNYAYYRHSIRAAVALQSPDSINHLIDTLHSLRSITGDHERAPSLALLELDMRLRQAPFSEDESNHKWKQLSEDDWKQEVERYWTRWGSKGSTVVELEAIAEDKQQRLEEFLTSCSTAKHHDEKSYREVVNASIYLLRQKPRDWVTDEVSIKRCWELYTSGLEYGRNLPKTDVQPADEIGLTAVHLLLSLYNSSPSETTLLQSVLCLEWILNNSPSCAYARFLLVRLYRLIGAQSLAIPHLAKLKPSEVQLDNMLHILTERGGVDALLGGTKSVWVDYTEQAGKMYRRTATDLPEYVKQCLEHESYSKIHGIRTLHQKLSSSVSAASLEYENARLVLLTTGSMQSPTDDALQRVVDKPSLEDNRNWELMPDIGGQRKPVREITALGAPEGEKGVKAKCAVLLAVYRFSQGEEVSMPSIPDDTLLPAEEEVVGGALRVLKRALRVISAPSSNGGSGDGEETSQPLSYIYDGLIKLSSQTSTRSEKVNTLASIAELSRLLDLIASRISDLARPKGKKKPPQGVLDLSNELKATKEGLRGKIRGVVGGLNGLIMDDGEVDWVKVSGGYIKDDDFVKKLGREITSARIKTLENLKSLLEGKNV